MSLLRYKADVKTLVYMLITTALLPIQWYLGAVNPILYPIALFMAVSVAVMAHNHNHLPIWRSKLLNNLTDYWITMFYGFPAFAWVPTHNKNHHVLNNREGDHTITYRVSERNNFLTLVTYPSISGYFQQQAIFGYLKNLYQNDRRKFAHCIMQYVVLVAFVGGALLIDWKKALLYIVIPQQFALFSVLIFNYIQHVHADEESEWNHSRNFVGFLNAMLFNNGYHTVHHHRAGLHWSLTPEAHKKIEHNIDPVLLERSFWWYIIRSYILSPFVPKFRTDSMRLRRMEQQKKKTQTTTAAPQARTEEVVAS